MSTLETLSPPVNLAAAEAAYKRASAAVDARLAETSDPNDARLLALIADEEAAYEAMFHHAAERQRRARMVAAGVIDPSVECSRECWLAAHARVAGGAL